MDDLSQGSCHIFEASTDIHVALLVAQKKDAKSNSTPLSFTALEKALDDLSWFALHSNCLNYIIHTTN